MLSVEYHQHGLIGLTKFVKFDQSICVVIFHSLQALSTTIRLDGVCLIHTTLGLGFSVFATGALRLLISSRAMGKYIAAARIKRFMYSLFLINLAKPRLFLLLQQTAQLSAGWGHQTTCARAADPPCKSQSSSRVSESRSSSTTWSPGKKMNRS